MFTTGAVATLMLVGFAVVIQSCSRPSPYKEVLPQRGDLTAKILTSGRVQPDNRVNITAPVGGRAETILVQAGDKVKRGQIMMWMSSDVRAAIIDAARVAGASEATHWEKRIPPTPVIAPVDGLIIQRNVEPGQSFGDRDPILVLSDRFVIEAAIDETDVSRIIEGQAAVTVLDAFPEHSLPSKVLRISHEATKTENVTTYRLEVELDEVPDFVRVGMTANVNFEMTSRKEALLIPSDALRANEDGIYIFVGEGGGRPPEKRQIQIGLTDGSMTEVVSGLKDKEVVYIPLPKDWKTPAKQKPKAFLPL